MLIIIIHLDNLKDKRSFCHDLELWNASQQHSKVQCIKDSIIRFFCQKLPNCLSFSLLCHITTIHRAFFLQFFLRNITINEHCQTVI